MDGVGTNAFPELGSAEHLPALAVKEEKMPPGSPFRRGPMNSDDLVGSRAVTAAAAAVQETRARMERVSSRADAAADPSSPPAPCHRADPGQPSSAKRRKSSAGTPAATPSSAGGAPSSAGGTAEKDGKGKGLRHFSMKVCEKVQSKMKTTYNEVADELVAEFSNPDDPRFCADQAYDEKNIRRRVYDALNVLMAMDIIAKEKKEIMWRGLPSTSEGNAARLHAELAAARASIEKKNAHLQELVEQYNSYQALLKRNARRAEQVRRETGAEPAIGGIQLPFILVQTKPHATVEVEISEDQQVVHFDFNSTPFQIHDGNFVLASMNLGMDGLSLEEQRAEEEARAAEAKAEAEAEAEVNGAAMVGEAGGSERPGRGGGRSRGKPVNGDAGEATVKVEPRATRGKR